MRYHAPVAPLPLEVGQQIHLAGDTNLWTVKAVTEHFTAATRPVTIAEGEEWPAGGYTLHTVLDWRNGVRGPCDQSGQAWDYGNCTETDYAQMLDKFEAGDLKISLSNQVRIEFAEVAA